LANAKLLSEKQTSELAQQAEEICKLRSQLDSSPSDADVIGQRDALLQRITVSNVLLLCRLIPGTACPTPLPCLPVLANIEPPRLRRKAASAKLVKKAVAHDS